MRSNHQESQKQLLSKYKFLSKLIDHYMTTKQFTSGFRGYIIKITNYLRLTSDTQAPGDYLRNFLSSHEAWKEFLPVLKDETFGQLVTDYPPPVHSGPLNPFIQHDFSSYAAAKPIKPLTRDDISIDLGSKYANGLGFEGKSAFATPEQKRKRKRNKKNIKKSGESSGTTLGNSIQTEHSEAASNGNSAEKNQVSGAKNENQQPVGGAAGERKSVATTAGPVAKENGEDGSSQHQEHQGQQVGKSVGTKATEQKGGGVAETNHAS